MAHNYDGIQIGSLDAGPNQRLFIDSEQLVRSFLGRVAYEVFECDRRRLPVRSLFRLQADGEDETLVGMHYFADDSVDGTMHTVSVVPRDLEDREFIGLDEVTDPEEFLRLVSKGEVAECSYVLESEYDDHPDIYVDDMGDIAALEALIAVDSADAKQKAS